MRLYLKFIALVGASLAIAGCGVSSSGQTTSGTSSVATRAAATSTSANAPSAFTASVEAICAQNASRISAVRVPLVNPARFKRFVGQAAGIERKTLGELDNLTPPASIEPSWHHFQAARHKLIFDLDKLSRLGVTDAIGNKGTYLNAGSAETKLRAIAKQNGFTNCAS